MTRTLQRALLTRLDTAPDARAIAFVDDKGRFAWQTVGDYFGQAARHATYLAEAGLRKGGVCVIVLSSGDLASRIVLGTLWRGAVPLLVAPPSLQAGGAFSSLRQVLQSVIARTGPDLVLIEDSLQTVADELRADPVCARSRVLIAAEPDPAMPAWRVTDAAREDDRLALQLTSGTTGMPKICSWSNQRVWAALDGMAEAMAVSPADVFLNWTPLYHDMGLVNNFFLCLAKNIPLGMMKPQDFVKNPSLWLRTAHNLQATTTWSPNFGFALAAQRCRDADLAGVDLSHVVGFWSAAERIHHETMQAFYARFKDYGLRYDALKTNFGCAENVGGATFSAPGQPYQFEQVDRDALFGEGVARGAGAGASLTVVGAGKGYPGLAIHILDDDGGVLPDGHVGQIALDSPSRLVEYLGDPEATADALSTGWLRTGDLGYLRDGELFWVGRVRERINIRGVKLDPSDFESILGDIEGVRPGCFAAFGVDDAGRGTQRVVIVAEGRLSAHRSAASITEDIRNRVFSVLGLNVDDVVMVAEGTLTKTSSGKRRHRFVKHLYETGRLGDFALAATAGGARG